MEPLYTVVKTDYYISSQIFSEWQTPLRRVNEYELELYTTSGNISVVDGVEYTQTAGNLLVARPGNMRYSKGAFECHCVHFLCRDPDIVRALERLPTISHYSDTEALEQLFLRLPEAHRLGGFAGQLCIDGVLNELLGQLIAKENESYSGHFERYAPNVERACEYMKRELEHPLTLAAIAGEVHLSPGFFHTVFKDMKGTTPAKYLTGLRVRRAKEYLRKSNRPLAEIAVLCGFGHQGYFNYVFKKETGSTPKAYRDRKQIII